MKLSKFNVYIILFEKKNYVNLWVWKNAIKMFALSLKKDEKRCLQFFSSKNQPYILFYEFVKKPSA